MCNVGHVCLPLPSCLVDPFFLLGFDSLFLCHSQVYDYGPPSRVSSAVDKGQNHLLLVRLRHNPAKWK